MAELRIAGVVDDSIVDGPGVRYTIFTQGCAHNCDGCHNKQTHDYRGGTLVDIKDLLEDIQSHKYIKAVTLSGGEPLDQPIAIKALVEDLKSKGYHILIFTGYTYEQIFLDSKKFEIVKQVDIIIDGKFDINLKSLNINFRGSTNQRIIDIQKTLEKKEISLLNFDKID